LEIDGSHHKRKHTKMMPIYS